MTLDRRWGGDHWGPGKARRTFGDQHWLEPLKWDREASAAKVRRKVFCASMADVFDAEAPPGALDRLWGLIRATPNLDWLLLTKRPERIAQSLPEDWMGGGGMHAEGRWRGFGYPNVWLGASVENQKYADIRIPILARIPAQIRFLSAEPLLGPIQLPATRMWPGARPGRVGYLTNGGFAEIHWVIVGGESGPGARPMDPAWARSLRDQCHASGVAYFLKQMGSVAGPHKGADAIPKDLQIREFPDARRMEVL